MNYARVIAMIGICGYGPDWRTQPGRLGFGVGTNGYGPMVETYLAPVVKSTGCRRILLHNPFPNGGEKEIPFDGPIRLRDEMPAVHETFEPAFTALKNSVKDSVEVIQYHGCATQLKPLHSASDLVDALDVLAGVFELAIACGHSVAVDMASAMDYDHPLALLMPAASRLPGVNSRFYMEQRPRHNQPYMLGIPTMTMYSELLRQQDRGGEGTLRPFDTSVENVLVLDVAPPDRDPMEGWDPWILDQVEALQADGFTVAVPIHSMVRRNRWDLLRHLFGDPS
ncbi:MAG: hypothetical protein L6Q35_00555 [Phycisphaerales bacterium]|nr:hypothetical protein [Phycisphaerales bacterium]